MVIPGYFYRLSSVWLLRGVPLILKQVLRGWRYVRGLVREALWIMLVMSAGINQVLVYMNKRLVFFI